MHIFLRVISVRTLKPRTAAPQRGQVVTLFQWNKKRQIFSAEKEKSSEACSKHVLVNITILVF